jgi:hypothetical protein
MKTKPRQLGHIITEHDLTNANTTDDPLTLVQTHFDGLVEFVRKRGLIGLLPKSGREFLLFHRGRRYQVRTEPPLTELQARMVGNLYRVEHDIDQLRIRYQAGDVRRVALLAWELGRDMFIIQTAIEFDREVGIGLASLTGGPKGNKTKIAIAKEKARSHCEFVTKAMQRPPPRTASYSNAVREAHEYFAVSLSLIYRNTRHLNPRRRARK